VEIFTPLGLRQQLRVQIKRVLHVSKPSDHRLRLFGDRSVWNLMDIAIVR
jgi:hypothetical protein